MSLISSKKTAALVAALVGVLALAVTFTTFYETDSYAWGGDKPYVVKIDGEKAFAVKDKATAEKVIAAVMDEYTPDGAQINSITVDKQINIRKSGFFNKVEDKDVMTEDDAVAYVLEQNQTDKPLFNVTIDASMGKVKSVDASTKYKEDKDLYEDEQVVKAEGSKGSQIVTNDVISVNGVLLTSEEIDRTVIDEGESRIVYKGIKDIPAVTGNWGDASDQVVGSGNGAAIARYACRYIGLPYVWGGNSLETGADCGGFVMAVFAKFGLSVPRGSYSNFQRVGSLSAAKAGDVVVWPWHVAIYIGGGKVVHELNARCDCCVTSVYRTGSNFKIYRIVQ